MAGGVRRQRSWRDLKKKDEFPQATGKRRPLSMRARLKSWKTHFLRLLAAVAVVAICYGAYYAATNGVLTGIISPKAGKIKKFELKTDGVISAAWIFKYIDLPKDVALSDINIFFIKELLDSVGQIKSSNVSRIYPDTLRVTISEYAPIAKIAVKPDAKIEYYLLSADGKFFKPVCISDESVARLPSLRGIKLILSDSGPLDYPFANILNEFLKCSAEKMPVECMKWRTIDLSELSSLTAPLISVISESGAEYVFAAKDFEKQLDRLDYILKYSTRKPLIGITRIDLSLSDRAVVELAK